MGRFSLFNNRVGTTFESKKWLTLDLCGLSCSTLSYSLHIFAMITIYHYLIKPLHSSTDTAGTDTSTNSGISATHIIFYAIYVPISLLALSSLFMAQHSNPGAVPLGARPLPVFCTPVSSPLNGSGSNSNDENGNNGLTLNSKTSNDSFDDNDDGKSLLVSMLTHSTDTTGNDIGPGSTSISGISMSARKRRRRGIRRCRKCNDNYKPTRAHHDSVTGRCVVKFDHFW